MSSFCHVFEYNQDSSNFSRNNHIDNYYFYIFSTHPDRSGLLHSGGPADVPLVTGLVNTYLNINGRMKRSRKSEIERDHLFVAIRLKISAELHQIPSSPHDTDHETLIVMKYANIIRMQTESN